MILSSANEVMDFIEIWYGDEFKIADNGQWLKMILVIVVHSKESELQSRPLFLERQTKLSYRTYHLNFHSLRAFHPNQSTVIKLMRCI